MNLSVFIEDVRITAFNYDETADVDDSSCIPFIEGCMNVNYIEYNPEANSMIIRVKYNC